MLQLKPSHEAFCREYAAGVNGAEAARRAGYAAGAARQTAYDLLQRPEISKRIAELEAEGLDRDARERAALAARLDPLYEASLRDGDRDGVIEVVELQACISGHLPGGRARRSRSGRVPRREARDDALARLTREVEALKRCLPAPALEPMADAAAEEPDLA